MNDYADKKWLHRASVAGTVICTLAAAAGWIVLLLWAVEELSQ